MSKELARDDVRRMLGDVEDDAIAEILALEPSLADIEAVAVWVNGDDDVLGNTDHPLGPVAAAIIEILLAYDFEEEP